MSGATIAKALAAAAQELTIAGIETPGADARRLMAFALEIAPDRVTLMLPEPISHAALSRLDGAIAKRVERQPVSHILGHRLFWGREFRVTPAVLDPRPETEILIEQALKQPFQQMLDLGTGSGCILLTLLAETPDARGLGVDASPDALEIAAQNCAALNLDSCAALAESDWFSALNGTFDLIVANPPYIALSEMVTLAPEVLRWEPMAALCPGPDGLQSYREIAAGITRFLAKGGRLLLEVGPTQAQAVREIFKYAGLVHIATHPDLDGRDRVVELAFAPKK